VWPVCATSVSYAIPNGSSNISKRAPGHLIHGNFGTYINGANLGAS